MVAMAMLPLVCDKKVLTGELLVKKNYLIGVIDCSKSDPVICGVFLRNNNKKMGR